ncbi:ROK family protein [Clostridium sp. MCC353]|uniref:ROK family transcriptional regulator n=1 Tax=Clostridium sp. MCC353 TaxID=2592646 RepID=UPI001C017539|nr:ROK family transcriptional regulator [Clostridium sp. MCC353]MBT9779348.1 ROK family protein [Clostridium sp. MCC353]
MEEYLLKDMSLEQMAVLRTIFENEVASKDEIIEKTGFKGPTANRFLESLKEAGYVVVCGEGDSTGGRRPLLYSLNGEKRIFSVGLMIGLYHIDVAVLHYSGKLVDLKSKTMNGDYTPQEGIFIIEELYHKILEENGILPQEVKMAGMSAFCSVQKTEGAVLNVIPSMLPNQEWTNFPLKQKVSEVFNTEVIIETSANGACMGEYLLGQGKHCSNLCFLLCGGGGIRIGSIQNGTIIRPIYNQDDAFSHMVIVAGGERCECGNYGCINAYSSAKAIVKRFVTLLKMGRSSSLEHMEIGSITVQDILSAADEGDFLAEEVVTQAATMLSVGIANYINIMNPTIFVYGGIMVENHRLYREIIRENVQNKVPFLKENHTLFCCRSNYGKPVIGNGLLAIEALLGRRY